MYLSGDAEHGFLAGAPLEWRQSNLLALTYGKSAFVSKVFKRPIRVYLPTQTSVAPMFRSIPVAA